MPLKKTLPRPALTRQAAIAKAIALADQSGIDALSMRQLAQSLGVEAMSLYNHVINKDDLIDGMVDTVIGEVPPPRKNSGDWKAEMRARAIAAHHMLLRHLWAAQLIASRINVGPNMLRYIDCTAGCLLRAGFSVPLTDHAWNALDSHIYGFTILQQNFPLERGEYAAAAAQFLPMIPEELYPDMRKTAEAVIAGRHSGINEFEFGLELILEGLERKLVK